MKTFTVKSLKQFFVGTEHQTSKEEKQVNNKNELTEVTLIKLNGKIIPYRRNRKPELL